MSVRGRILVVTPPLANRGGVAHYYRALRAHLGPDVEYFTRGGGGDQTGLTGALRLFKDVRRFERRMHSSDERVVLLNPSFGYKSLVRDRFFLSSAKRAGKPIILFFRGWDLRCERIVRRYLLSWFRAAFFKADLIMVLSRGFERSLRDMGFDGPIVVETTLVPDSVFDSADARLEASSAAPKPTFDVLFLSRLERDKGIYDAIEAHKLVVDVHPHVRLKIAGAGRELERARELVRSQRIPGVSFLGYVHDADKESAFREADLYFFPSYYGEGMPNSVLEAMAYGLAIVTRPVGGLRDFFQNEKMGYITDTRAPEKFAELIGSLVVNARTRRDMGRFNRAYAQEHFKASAVAGRLRAVCARFL